LIKNVCKDCQERSPACWGSCPKYLEAKAEHERQKKLLRDEQAITNVQYHAHRVYIERQGRKEKQKGF